MRRVIDASDYRVIPWTTSTDPVVSVYDLSELDCAIADEQAHGFIRVLTRPGTDRILGVT